MPLTIQTPRSSGASDSVECSVITIGKQRDQLCLRFWTIRAQLAVGVERRGGGVGCVPHARAARATAISGESRGENRCPAMLTQSIGEAQRDMLQSFNQDIVVESAMELWLLRHRTLRAFVQGDRRSMSVHRGAVIQALNVWIGVVQLTRPGARSRTRPGMYRRGSAYLCRKRSAYIQKGDGFAKREDNEPRSIPSAIDAARGLENFGGTRVNVRRTVEDRPVLLNGYAVCVWQVMVPASGGRTEAAKLIPA